MKVTDDYSAKIDIWAKDPKVCAVPKIANLPPFRSKKFSSYEEMNEWKRAYMERIALNGGVKWTK